MIFTTLLAVSIHFISTFSFWDAGQFPLYNSLEEIPWHAIKIEDERNQLQARLPGTLENPIREDRVYLFRSIHRDVHYALFFNPQARFQPPASTDEMITLFRHLDHDEMIPLIPLQPNVLYLLEIHATSYENSSIKSVMRIYATEHSLYFAVVKGRDLAYASDFFESISIEK